MNRFTLVALAMAAAVAMSGGFETAPVSAQTSQKSKSKPKPKPVAKPCVEQIYVIQGCSACETMMKWLRDGGVKLDMRQVEQSSYDGYPTVIYSDKRTDNGERMYAQQVTIPAKICIVTTASGIE